MTGVFSPSRSVEAVQQGLLEARDLMGFAMASALENVEEEIAKDGWDQVPMLFLLRRELADPETLKDASPAGCQMDGFIITVRLMAGGEAVGRDGPDIAARLRWIASRVKDYPGEVEDASCFGWALLNEAYMLDADTVGASEMARHDISNESVHAHPKRVEIRFLMGVDQAGVVYQLLRRRLDDRRALLVNGVNTDDVVGGELADSLRALAEATR